MGHLSIPGLTSLTTVWGGLPAYNAKVLALSPSVYWPLWDTSGTEASDITGNNWHGLYVNSPTLGEDGIGDGRTCPSFDASNDYVNIYVAGFVLAFSGLEGTVNFWARVSAADEWTDNTERYLIHLYSASDQYVRIYKPTNSGQLIWEYASPNTTQTVTKSSVSTTDWMPLGITWSVTGGATGEVKAYYNGTQEGSTQTGLGAWNGLTLNTATTLGASSTAPAALWKGKIAHVAWWDSVLDATQIATLATV